MVDSNVWFLAAGKKKVGPWSATRVRERFEAGKLPGGALAWREGMGEWRPVDEITELGLGDGVTEVLVAPEKKVKSDAKLKAKSDAKVKAKSDAKLKAKSDAKLEVKADAKPASKNDVQLDLAPTKVDKASATKPALKASATRSAVRPKAAAAATPEVGAFQPRHRIERQDVWRGFGLGLERTRVLILLATLGAAVAGSGVLLGLAFVASKLHVVLALPFLLAMGAVGVAASGIGMGALSYHSRRRLADEDVGVKEALAFAARRAPALVGTPLLLSVAWIVPLVALVLLSLLLKIPYLGPIGTGAAFGAHLALSATALFLLVCAGMGAAFAPVVVAFEDTGLIGTLRGVMAFVRRATARVFLWGALPSLAFTPFTAFVVGVGLVVLALPLAAVGASAGASVLGWVRSGMVGDAPLGGLMVGAVPLALWVSVFVVGLCSIPVSVNNALLSFLYLGGREGNDELISRDAYLAARASNGGAA